MLAGLRISLTIQWSVKGAEETVELGSRQDLNSETSQKSNLDFTEPSGLNQVKAWTQGFLVRHTSIKLNTLQKLSNMAL